MGPLRRINRASAPPVSVEHLGEGQVDRATAQATDDSRDHFAQRVEMVAALEGHDEAVAAERSTEIRRPANEFDVSGRRERERRERVPVVRVDPQAHEDRVGPELLEDRLHDLLVGGPV